MQLIHAKCWVPSLYVYVCVSCGGAEEQEDSGSIIKSRGIWVEGCSSDCSVRCGLGKVIKIQGRSFLGSKDRPTSVPLLSARYRESS